MKNSKKKEDFEIPIIYLYIYSKMKTKFGVNRLVNHKHLCETLRRFIWQIPWNYNQAILIEMEQFKLIRRIDKYHRQIRYEILNNPCEKKLHHFEEYFYW